MIELSIAWKHSIECPYCKEHLQYHSKTCPRCHGIGIERIQHSLQSIEKQEIQTTVQELKSKTKDEIVEERYQKFRKISGFKEV